MMKAVRLNQFGGPEVLEIVDLPDPHPGPGHVRIAVSAAGVNPSDWKKRKGLMDEELPQTMGYEAAGVVDQLGEADGPEHVVTIADFAGAQEYGVTFSSGDAGRAVHALAEIGELIESGRFSLPVAQTFPLTDVAEAHRVSELGHVRGKLVLSVG
jgi:NADPH:quinone reductase-like Zn-dependent oxidoreductase